MSAWALVFDDFVPEEEGLREALCTLGNGVFATRGAAPEAVADDVHYPGTYAAGLYDRLRTEVAGRVVENEDLVNLPNWLPLTFRPEDGDWLDLARTEILRYRQELDLRAGVLTRSFRYRDAAGRTTAVTERRLVSMADPRLAAIEVTVVPEDWSGRLVVRSALDGTVTNSGVARYRNLRGDHLVPLSTDVVAGDVIGLVVETRDSHVRIGEAVRTRLFHGEAPLDVERRTVGEEGFIAQEMTVDMRAGEALTVEKVACLVTSRTDAIYEPGADAARLVVRAGGFDELRSPHELAWHQLWRRFDIQIEGSERAQMILRLHVFHLLQTVSPNIIGLDVSVPARGLHGEAYRGHIFWDELFIFPLLSFRLPVLTRSLLNYRFRRLPEARSAARRAGFEGALFPWQSGSSGREESQSLHLNPHSGRWLPDHSYLQRHIGLAVAYNVWQYHQISGDAEFLRYRGAPLLIEIARFFASAATFDPASDRYEICGVMGPDEYHDAYPDRDEPGLNNNAYTNVMAVWLFCRTLELIDGLAVHDREALSATLRLTLEELERWEDISRKMFVPFHDGVISQFDGYEELLEEFDWAGTGSDTGTSRVWTGSSKPRATLRTGTRSRSRPMCSCSSTCCPPTSCGSSSSDSATSCRPRRSRGPSTTTSRAHRTAPPCPVSSMRGSWLVRTASSPGGCSPRPSRATSLTCRAARRPKGSTWARWRAPSTCSNAGTRVWRHGETSCGSTQRSPRRSER